MARSRGTGSPLGPMVGSAAFELSTGKSLAATRAELQRRFPAATADEVAAALFVANEGRRAGESAQAGNVPGMTGYVAPAQVPGLPSGYLYRVVVSYRLAGQSQTQYRTLDVRSANELSLAEIRAEAEELFDDMVVSIEVGVGNRLEGSPTFVITQSYTRE